MLVKGSNKKGIIYPEVHANGAVPPNNINMIICYMAHPLNMQRATKSMIVSLGSSVSPRQAFKVVFGIHQNCK